MRALQPAEGYASRVRDGIAAQRPSSITDMEYVIASAAFDAAAETDHKTPVVFSPGLLRLRNERKHCSDRDGRRELSKKIQKETRSQLRQWKSERVQSRLELFRNIYDLHIVHRIPLVKARPMEKPPPSMNGFLADMFSSGRQPETFDTASLQRLQLITPWELKLALRQMARGKCRDKAGISLEMILHGGDTMHNCLVSFFNRILRTGIIDGCWKETMFSMIPKSGDLGDPANWRPIAILKNCYKLFARIIHNRIKQNLNDQQAEDQMGFRPGRGTNDALIILESIISKSVEFNAPLWFASLDLRKAFDRIEWPQLFQALSEQNLPIEYQCLLSCLYNDQVGVLAGGDQFPIRRGVRQGDVLSPLLFNAGLEQALRCWKHWLSNHGIKLDNGDKERLTNVRFADDLIIYAKRMSELVDALDILAEELQNVGLDLNAKKS